MTLMSKAASILGYRIFPTSILAISTYLGLFITLIITNVLPNPPNATSEAGLNLNQAYKDLLHITAHPHPYNSHANDHVRSYILQRLVSMTKSYPYVHIDDDLISNGSWASGHGVYFEGTNILVKIDGSAPKSEGGVLFSAHYDSVSTAPGATDDGMGVATLLQLVQYFSDNRMPMTAVFNINNGEEDWLNGAHAFLQHPWSNLTEVFVNLEGAAAGGWPILFRATSTSAVKSFRNVPHPHANVLSSDAFARGFIRSGTDYSVYATPGPRKAMEGLDVAFYKGRSKYHTKYDAPSFTLGGQRSLWSMMEMARSVGVNLLSAPLEENESLEADKNFAVYFDLFKSTLLVLPISRFLTLNIVTLIIGPIVFMLFGLCKHFLTRSHERPSQAHPRVSTQSADATPQPSQSRSFHWLEVLWRNIKFWIALCVAIGLEIVLIWGYVLFNPFAVYSLPYTVLFSFLSLAYLALMFVLTFPSSLPFYNPTFHVLASATVQAPALQQKYTIFFHLYTFTWILLVLSTIGITKVNPPVGGGYFFTTWNIAAAIGCLLAVIESMVLTCLGYQPPTVIVSEEAQHSQHEGDQSMRAGRSFGSQRISDERTPLLPRDNTEARRHDGRLLPSLKDLSGEEEGAGTLATWWWIPQFLVSVPIPVILFAHVTTLLLDAMAQTLADGLSPWNVYTPIALLALMLILPLAPFSYKLRPFRPLTLLVLLVFVLSTIYTWLAFPFAVQDPLKVSFRQIVVLPSISAYSLPNITTSVEPTLFTALSGPERYLRSLVSAMPSSQGKSVSCRSERGLTTCEWQSGRHMKPVPGAANNSDIFLTDQDNWNSGEFFKADVLRIGATTARIRVKGRNTRSCRLYFDNQAIFKYDVLRHDETGSFLRNGTGMQKGYDIPSSGIREVRLWSRTWEKEFVVDIEWEAKVEQSNIVGRIACEWNEYESGLLDNGPLEKLPRNESRPKIPAFEEVLYFLPHWAVVTKAADGLVEVSAPFVV